VIDAVARDLRWRLVLGRYASESLGSALAGPQDSGRDAALTWLYDRSFAERSAASSGTPTDGLTVPAWLGGVRDLFPETAVRVLERDALARYGLLEVAADPEVLRRTEPSMDLARALLQLRPLLRDEVLGAARVLVGRVVAELGTRWRQELRPALNGLPRPDGRPPLRSWRNVDWPRTVRENLDRWDGERLALRRLRWRHRVGRRPHWRVIALLDQSGSMTDSLIHASVMAAIIASLPSVDTRLLLFDHRVTDLSELVRDPLEVLFAAQLGGGTDLVGALGAARSLVEDPHRTLLWVVSDFQVGEAAGDVVAAGAALVESGVRCLGAGAVTPEGVADVHELLLARLAEVGWTTGVWTPHDVAERVGRILA
jgi:hypothetical protein